MGEGSSSDEQGHSSRTIRTHAYKLRARRAGRGEGRVQTATRVTPDQKGYRERPGFRPLESSKIVNDFNVFPHRQTSQELLCTSMGMFAGSRRSHGPVLVAPRVERRSRDCAKRRRPPRSTGHAIQRARPRAACPWLLTRGRRQDPPVALLECSRWCWERELSAEGALARFLDQIARSALSQSRA